MASDGVVVERLDGEDEEKDKLVYLCIYSRPLDYVEGKNPDASFFKFDGANTHRVDDVMVYNNKTFPPDLLRLANFGCTAWKSKIYIVGGFPFGGFKDHQSNKVYIYDTLSHEWKTSVMNLQRGSKPMVVAADDKIFVFGGCHKDLDIEVWSEFCDIADDAASEWHYLPGLAPEHLKSHPPQTHAVHQRGNKILFFCNAPRLRNDGFKYHERFSINKGRTNELFCYNYCVNMWHRYDYDSQLYRHPFWTEKVAVIEDFIFWHLDQRIYANDLASDAICMLYLVPEAASLNREQKFHLVHLGKNRLGLFCCAYGSRVWYHTILVRISDNPVGIRSVRLVPDCTGYFDARYPYILHAFDVPS